MFIGLTARVANETQADAKNCPDNVVPMKTCRHPKEHHEKTQIFLSELPAVRCGLETNNFHTIRET
jgi:hypothetical protein